MDLYIDTADKKNIRLSLRQGRQVLAKKELAAEYQQAEKLLPAIDQLLKNVKANVGEIKKIYVANRGQSFTALRIGVVVANALAFALGVKVFPSDEKNKDRGGKFNIVKPVYHKEPNITNVD